MENIVHGEATFIRVAKIAAVLYEEPYWVALLDGGHAVSITEDEANKFAAILESANASDGNFFARGG